MKAILTALALAAGPGLTAGAAHADGTPASVDFGTSEWQLRQLDGAALKAPATISFAEAGRVAGQAPCNRYFGAVEISGTAISFGSLGATMMACEYLEDERAFLTALQGADMARREGATLTLSGGGHELVFGLPQ